MNILKSTANISAIIATIIVLGGVATLKGKGSVANEEPLVVSAVAPVFPPIAVATNTSGEVVIEVEINAAGEVMSAKTVAGHSLLREVRTFEETARRWRFVPAADKRTARLTFVFRIMPKATAAEELTPVFTLPYQVEVRHRPYEPVLDQGNAPK